jgi:hypothetical protein
MNRAETVIGGTIQPDGTLVLDGKLNLPAGRVTVVLRQEAEGLIPEDDPFWRRMQAMWDAQRELGHVPRSVEEIDARQREMREGRAERQETIEQLQEESRRLRHTEPGPQS